jgi:hypothetical protein
MPAGGVFDRLFFQGAVQKRLSKELAPHRASTGKSWGALSSGAHVFGLFLGILPDTAASLCTQPWATNEVLVGENKSISIDPW